MDIVEEVKDVATTVKEVSSVDHEFVDMVSLHALSDLKKEFELLQVKTELWKHKVALQELSIKHRFQIAEEDVIDAVSGLITRKK